MSPHTFEEALALVQKHHAGQYHANNVPVWRHLSRVAKRLDITLKKYNEMADEERKPFILAALGHDLLEDTDITKSELKDFFGPEGLMLIEGMTNENGDANVADYVARMTQAPEKVRLIKLSDLCDNITSVAYNLPALGAEWAHSYFLPIVTPMKEALTKTEFPTYPKTAAHLVTATDVTLDLLHDQLLRT